MIVVEAREARLATERLEVEAFVKEAFDEERLVLVLLVSVALVEARLVVVALVAVRLVKNAVTPFKSVAKKLELVAFVVELFVLYIDVAVSPVAEAFTSVVCPDTVTLVAEAFVSDVSPVAVRLPVERLDVDAFARFVCPRTVSVPLDVKEEVAVMLPPVRVEKTEVTAESKVAKKEVLVALVTTEEFAAKEPSDADEAFRLVIVPDATVRSLMVPFVIVVVANVVTPFTVTVAADISPSVEVPEVSVVIVAFVAVRFVKNAVTEFKRDEKKLVEVAEVARSELVYRVEVVAFPSVADEAFTLVIVPDAEVKSVSVVFPTNVLSPAIV